MDQRKGLILCGPPGQNQSVSFSFFCRARSLSDSFQNDPASGRGMG